jgi:hypothetical protein
LISANPAWQPEEMEMLQRVYKTILREEWFDRNDQNERDLARIIIGFFQRGIADEELIFVESLSVARTRFSKIDVVQPQTA